MSRFIYSCANCGAPAKKPALKALKEYRSAKPEDFGGLGSWHCTGGCKGKIKVTRQKNNNPPRRGGRSRKR